jgi:hypothetical protein
LRTQRKSRPPAVLFPALSFQLRDLLRQIQPLPD